MALKQEKNQWLLVTVVPGCTVSCEAKTTYQPDNFWKSFAQMRGKAGEKLIKHLKILLSPPVILQQ